MVDYTQGAEFQYHTHASGRIIGKYVLLTGDPGRCQFIASYLEQAEMVASNREYVIYTGFLLGERVSVCSTGIGGPSAAIAMEELYRCGAHTFIRIGTCGGIQLEVEGGDIVIATGAIRMEGTSKEYAPIEYPAVASFEIVKELARVADEMKIRHHIGVVHCKDSFFGEVNPEESPVYYELTNKWNAWKKCGALASEMESASLFICGGIYRLRVGTALLVLDNQEREKQGLCNIQVHDISKTISVAIQAIKALIVKDSGLIDCQLREERQW